MDGSEDVAALEAALIFESVECAMVWSKETSFGSGWVLTKAGRGLCYQYEPYPKNVNPNQVTKIIWDCDGGNTNCVKIGDDGYIYVHMECSIEQENDPPALPIGPYPETEPTIETIPLNDGMVERGII